MAVLDDLDFEGTYPPSGWAEAGTAANIGTSTTQKNSGTTSVRVSSASAATAWITKTYTSKTLLTTRVYIYFNTFPSANAALLTFANAQGEIWLRYVTGTNVFRLSLANGTLNYNGPSVSLNTWYYVDMRVNASTGTLTVDWAVNGAAQTQRTNTQTSANLTAINMGVTSSTTHDIFYDDLKVTDVSGDYPIGPTGSPQTFTPGVLALTLSTFAPTVTASGATLSETLDFEGTYPPSGWAEAGTAANVGTSTVQKNSGTTSLRVNSASAATAWITKSYTSKKLFVFRAYIRFAAFPSANVALVTFANAQGEVWLRYVTTNKFRLSLANGGLNYDGPTVALDTWYFVDMRVNSNTGTMTVDWSVDGVAQTQRTNTQTSADNTAINLGITSSSTHDVYYDDVKITDQSGDYPIGQIAGSATATPGTLALVATKYAPTVTIGSGTYLEELDFEGSYPPTDYTEQGTTANVGTSTNFANSFVTALRVNNATATQAWIRRTTGFGNSVYVLRCHVYVTTLPSITSSLIQFDTTSGNGFIGMTTAGNWRVSWAGSANQDGPAVTTGIWHYVDARFNTSVSPATIEWRVDGVTQLTRSNTQTAAPMTAFNVGVISTVTADIYFDDLVISAVSADYPLGPDLGSQTITPDVKALTTNLLAPVVTATEAQTNMDPMGMLGRFGG